MLRCTVLFCVLFLCRVSAQEPEKVLGMFIQQLDQYIQKENMSEIKINSISEDFGIVKIAIDGGYVKNLSSIELTPNSVALSNTTAGKLVSFQVDFRTLELYFGMVQLDALFLNIDDDVSVTARKNSLSMKLQLSQTNDKCQISVVDATSDLGNFDVTLKAASDEQASLIDNILAYFVEKVLNIFASKVETFLNPQLQQTLNSLVSSMDQINLCQII